VQNGGIYRSRDYGETWTTVVNELDRYWTSDSPWELTFEVSAAGDYYVSSHRQFFVSRDEGHSWTMISELSRMWATGYNRIIAHRDSTLFAERIIEGSYYVRSKDQGKTWDTVRTPTYWRTLHVDPLDSKISFLGGSNMVYSTVDGGVSWRNSNEIAGTAIGFFGLHRRDEGARAVYLIWCNYRYSAGNSKGADLYESRDTGVTWQRRNTQTIDFNNYNSVTGITDPAFYLGDIYLVNIWNRLYRSTDAGVTWTQVLSDGGVWDLVETPRGVLVSTTFKGIQLSEDSCRSWHDCAATRAFPGGAAIDVRAASGGRVYASLSDKDYSGYTHGEFLTSADYGEHWRALYAQDSVGPMVVRYQDGDRYFLALNATLVSGTAEALPPDTVFTGHGRIIGLELGGVPPYEIVVKNKDLWFFRSSDCGASWEDIGFPTSSYRDGRILPSLTIPGTYVGITSPNHSLDFLFIGIMHITNHGWNVEMTWEDIALNPNHFALCAADRLYWKGAMCFSDDYGKSWYRITDGLTASDISMLSLDSMWLHTEAPMLPVRDGIVSGRRESWVWFKDNVWRHIVHANGEGPDRLMPAAMDITDDTLYAACSNYGLYRTSINVITTGMEVPSPSHAASIACYPNPTAGIAVIAYTVPPQGSCRLQIVDPLGAMVFDRALQSSSGTLTVDPRELQGSAVSSGVFFVRIVHEGIVLKSRPVVFLK
jgi:photosystem II stability/assembly factor-like uncharacterized protein